MTQVWPCNCRVCFGYSHHEEMCSRVFQLSQQRSCHRVSLQGMLLWLLKDVESKLDLHFDVKFNGECDDDAPEALT